jgi:hypothetical protein
MKKKIFISIGVILVLFIGYNAYRIMSTRNLSPKGTITYSKNGVDISVTYGRPYKKDRLIFGTKDQGALVPYNEYWRLGANESTEIAFSKDVTFGGKPVTAGTYRMYTIPSENMWTIVLNTELGKWGAWDADHKLDVVKVEVAPTALTEPVEQFTIDFTEAGDQGVFVNFSWDKTKVSVPIK